MAITVREEKPHDVAAIREVNLAAFGQPQEADIVDKLRHSCKDLLSLVATVEDRVVGHILFSPASVDGEGKTVEGMGLAPMAVLPEFQRQGVGSELVRAGIGRLTDRGCPFVIVLGYPEYYPRFGFVPASRYGIRSEWDVPDEAFMIVVINESAIDGVTGVARYRPEFAEAM